MDKNKVCNADLYRDVANEFNISEKLVKDIVNAQSELTVQIIKRGAFESIRYVFLGKIGARLRHIQKINDLKGR